MLGQKFIFNPKYRNFTDIRQLMFQHHPILLILQQTDFHYVYISDIFNQQALKNKGSFEKCLFFQIKNKFKP